MGDKLKQWDVLLPMAGHVLVTVEAESKDAAIVAAFDADISLKNIEDFEVLKQFTKGNICYCPSPQEPEATLAFGEDDDEEETETEASNG